MKCYFIFIISLFVLVTLTKADEQTTLKIIDSSKNNRNKSNVILFTTPEPTALAPKVDNVIKVITTTSSPQVSTITPTKDTGAIDNHLADCAHLMNSDKEKNTNPNQVKGNKIDIPLPQIPQVTYNAHSLEIYSKKPDKIILSSKDESQFHYCFLKEIFEATRKTKPSEEYFNKNIFVLERGATREGIYHALVLDGVYLKLESKPKSIKVSAGEFAKYFCTTYTGYKLTSDILKSQNIYSIKRIVAEKALEVMDAFGENRNELENWYAVLSSDIADQFPYIWNNDLRRDPSKNVHKEWASKVPVQHIKSEVLIKLHSIFNTMM